MAEIKKEIVVALVGQPNCGKSTLFNAVAGFKVNTSNFPGTTVSFTETHVEFEGRGILLIDLPGTYALSAVDLAEKVTKDYLLSGKADVIVNVADASMLSRSFELTLQLIEMNVPMIMALNMIDEATRKGIEIDEAKFTELTGIPAHGVIAVRGKGIDELFKAVITAADTDYRPIKPTYDRDVEQCIADILAHYPAKLREQVKVEPRFFSIRLLEMDADFEKIATMVDSGFVDYVANLRQQLAEMHGWPESSVLSSHRHAVVLDMYEQVASHKHAERKGAREAIDRFITNPFGGFLVVALSFGLLFYASFWLGDIISGLTEGPFKAMHTWVDSLGKGIGAAIISGLSQGLEAGAGVILPYLIPLLILMALFEDTGLLPRIAFMLDGILHRVGLHGKSVVPIILGYGCNVPAIMSTRNLENSRDRFVTMLIIPFVTCSARTVVILALAGKYLGAGWALAVYVGSITITLVLSFILSRFDVNLSAGLIMEVPPLRKPYPAIIAKKVWLRLYEFIVVAWPVIVVASVILALFTMIGIDNAINWALSPLTTHLLGLPAKIGIALFLGIFRKELALLMLASALGTADISSVLTHLQILVLVIFTALYIPCIATLAALWKEGGWKTCLYSSLLNLGVALAVAGFVAHIGKIPFL